MLDGKARTDDVNMVEKISTNIPDVFDHYIVCIGASAGGMEAIHELFDNMPQNTGSSFIVIQHLSSDHKSLMAELLSKHTTMHVVEAQNGTPVDPDTVYVIPNNRNITIRDGALFLSHKQQGRIPNMAIDVFLNSLAEDAGKRAIAVILSGTGTDGTKGIAEIKKAGGLVYVQDPATAKFDGMPASAISSGMIDFILSPESIAEELLTHNKVAPPVIIVDSLPAEDEPLLQEIFHVILSRTGCDFRLYKRPTLIRRLTRRMAFLNCDSLGDYLQLLKDNTAEVGIIGKEFLVGVTRFFRDPEAFEELKSKTIPEIIKSKSTGDTIKIWSAACSTGEEAYSIAILLREYFNTIKADLDVKIFASDVNKDSIDFASKGCYPESIVNDVPRRLLEKYFIKEGTKYKVVAQLRKMIVFSQHDLLKDPPFGKLDLVSCRNMLIYVSPALQRRIMGVFHFSLNMGGYLFLGASEHIGELKDDMVEISKKWKIYRNNRIAKSIGIDSASYAESINRKFTLPGVTTSHESFRRSALEGIMNKVLDECSVAGALVDNNCNIIETFGDYRRYLHLPEKKFDHNLLKMLPARMSMIVGSKFRKAIADNEKQLIKNLSFTQKHPSLNITISPFRDRLGNLTVMILFMDLQQGEASGSMSVNSVSGDNGKTTGDSAIPGADDFLTLQAELKDTKEILEKAIEEAENTNEELQSSNEELISSNEELQSANEELQSLNEELHTVNAENQVRMREISELNDDLNNSFKSSYIGQVFLDKNLLIRRYTPSATALINLVDEDIGRPISDISGKIPHERVLNDIHHVLHYSEAIERTIQLADNVWYQMKVLPYLREGKYIDGVVLIFIDISEVKVAERLLEKANRELKEVNEHLIRSNRELEQFAYITSHDLQEPLRKIQTFADLTERNLTDHNLSKVYLNKIGKAALRMSLLIKDVLTYSRLAMSEEVFVGVDLNQVLTSVVDDFELIIGEKNAKVHVSDLHPVKGVPLQIHQLFSNLISNSLKFCEHDPVITVKSEPLSRRQSMRIKELSDQYSYIKITFADNGIGFDQQYSSKIFTIFQRLTHTKSYAGTGIGLALCKRIVENHHGAIFAWSALDCGATFEIYLPAA